MLDTFENYLLNYNYGYDGIVNDAFIYAINDGGKRIRPLLLLSLLADYGIDFKQGLSSALAIELIHSYSLAHDDLPAMDDDDFRRGKPSVHKAFGEDMAILAGDALLTMAFEVISKDELLNADQKVSLITQLAKYAGKNGMIYGQELDLKSENKSLTIDEIKKINIYKTSCLIEFSLIAASIISNNETDQKYLMNIAQDLGLAFQVQDDIFDVTKGYEELGKLPSDEDNNKSTYVKLLGVDESKVVLENLFENCFSLLSQLDLKVNNLYNLIKDIEKRTY